MPRKMAEAETRRRAAGGPRPEGGGAWRLLPVALDTYWQVRREIADDLQPFGLTTSQYLVLVHLVARRSEMGMAELARTGRHDPATMTAVVDSLVRRGWVARRRSATDRRRVTARLTPRGRRVHQLATRRLIVRWRRALGSFAGVEQLQLLSLLLRLLDGLHETARPA